MSAEPIVLQQALFTSLQAGENEGYQIAGHSPGVNAAALRELTAWGPSHDSLQAGKGESGSINGHTLSDGRYCLSLTRTTSDEYSGRGENVETSILIADENAIALCGHHPLRLFEAALGAGWTSGNVTEELSLVGRSQEVHLEAVAEACGAFSAQSMTALVERAGHNEPFAVVLDHDQRLLIDAMFSLLPIKLRTSVSFTTGLLPSAKRAFRLHLLAPQAELQNLFKRLTHGALLDLGEPQTQAGTGTGKKLAELLEAQKWSETRRFVLGE